MDLALLIITIISNLILFGFMGFIIWVIRKFPNVLGEKIRISKAQGSKIQAKMNDLVEADISHFINENPIMLDIFPESIAHMEQTRGQPQFLNSVISMFAPALSSVLMNSGSDRNLMANNVAGSLLSNPDAIGGILSFLGNLRNQAKANYKKPDKTLTQTSGVSYETAPVAEGL